jgi:hypothetical protein
MPKQKRKIQRVLTARVYKRPAIRSAGKAQDLYVYADAPTKKKGRMKRNIRLIALSHPTLTVKKGRVNAPDKHVLEKGRNLFLQRGGTLKDIADWPGPRPVKTHITVTREGKPLDIVIARGSFEANQLGVEAVKSQSEHDRRSMIRGKRSDRRSARGDSQYVHTLGAGASVLIVGNHIFLPQRSMRVRGMPGKIHVIAGIMKENQKTPKTVAQTEVSDETGISKTHLTFLRRKVAEETGIGKAHLHYVSAPHKKIRPVLITHEVHELSQDLLYLMKTKSDRIADYFIRNSDGTYRTKNKGPDDWEAHRWHRIKNTRLGITRFINRMSEHLSPTAYVALRAHCETLN